MTEDTVRELGDMHHKGRVVFETQGRLLQELGERLVSNAGVALTELIKNSYDADASKCTVKRVGKSIVVEDTGHGISEDDFKNRWMRIASSEKVKQRHSPRFKRKLTGAKGIGRFAVRFLGRELDLNTVYFDVNDKQRYRITATFDWDEIDSKPDLRATEIRYFCYTVDHNVPLGTTLTIKRLRNSKEIELSKSLKTQLMGIVSPISGLDRGHFSPPEDGSTRKSDPGFSLELPGEDDSDENDNLAEGILGRYHSRLIISLIDDHVTYSIYGQGDDEKPKLKRKIKVESLLASGLHADIRYFPKRKGMLQGGDVNGHKAWAWLWENSGVSVIDHGFRVPPYGDENDDWLNIDQDTAHNRRDWRSSIMQALYPPPKKGGKEERSDEATSTEGMTAEKSNPMLYLPHRRQLIGAVFIESMQESGLKYPTDITPASDREGFMKNAGFAQMVDLVRAGLEMIAYVDHKEVREQEREKTRKEAESLRSDLKSAVQFVRNIPSLREDDRERVIHDYKEIARKLENVEDYSRSANEKLATMSLLGVLAGFMTHESTRLISDLDKVISYVKELAKKDDRIGKRLPSIESTFAEFKSHVDYGSMFIRATHDYDRGKARPLPVRAQVRNVIDRFSHFTESRGIKAAFEGEDDLVGPRVPVALYSGVLLNLFTNALKATVARPAGKDQPRIVIKAWNEKSVHILEIVDNGAGIPPELEKRIWDPLFTTTSIGTVNPLGSGMGLGLTLVKATVERVGGKISLEKPPAGFKTCFRIRMPLNSDVR